MEDILTEVIIAKYIPDVIFKDNSIKGINFQFGNTEYTVQYSNMASDTINNIDEENFKLYNQINNNLNKWLINEKFISKFTDETRKIINEYSINPLSAMIEYTELNLNSLDMNKAYTSCLYEMELIPSYNVFDKYKIYDNHKIEDYTYYVVEFKENNIEVMLLGGQRKANIHGYIYI